MQLRNRVKEVRRLKASEVLPNPKNFRLHNDYQRQQLRSILGEVGYAGISLAYHSEKAGGKLVLLDGHLRQEEVGPDFESDYAIMDDSFSDSDADKVLLSFDWLGSLATIDEDKIKALSAEIETQTDAAKKTVDEIVAKYQEPIDTASLGNYPCDDRAEELQEKWHVELGQIWQSGKHNLICGDATKRETYEMLLGDEKAAMSFTDPPWNVAIGQSSNPRWRQRTGLENDNLSADDFSTFLNAFASVLPDFLTGDLYCVLGSSTWPVLDSALRSAGYHWSATIIWVKDLFVLGRSKYHRRYEPLWYGWHTKGKSSFCAGRDLDDVWEIKRPRVSEEHPTMKPVELVARAIVNSSEPGDLVLDSFLGSGTTLVACEQAGRVGRGIELEPKYVAVALERLASMGLEASLVE